MAPLGRQSSAFKILDFNSLHACAYFKIQQDFNKDYHPNGSHAIMLYKISYAQPSLLKSKILKAYRS